jgi:prepilin-type N-terminal cleavage/methylation domain-containing protein
MQPIRNSWKERGFGLIEVMVTIAITGIVGYAALGLMTSVSEVLGHLDIQDQLVDLQTHIKRNVDCTRTLPNTTLAAGTAVILRNRNGVDLSPAVTGSGPFAGAQNIMGQWYAKAVANGTGLNITVAKGDGTKFNSHPLFKSRRLDFTNTEYNPLIGLGATSSLCARSEDNSRSTAYFEISKAQLLDWIRTLPVLPNCGYGGGDARPMFCGTQYGYTFPHYTSLVCGEACRRLDYASGEMLYSNERIWDPKMSNGVWVRYWSPVPLNEQGVGCLCYK